MWMLDPALLCDSHLLGEHAELHKHRPSFVRRRSIAGRVSPPVQIEPQAMQRRHDELAGEMLRRGMRHQSPYEPPNLAYLPAEHRAARVDPAHSARDLALRCGLCRNRLSAVGLCPKDG